MKKRFWESMTFWGCAGWAVVGALQAFEAIDPIYGKIAQGVAAALTAFGLRRAMK